MAAVFNGKYLKVTYKNCAPPKKSIETNAAVV
jgi:hypothetical protein